MDSTFMTIVCSLLSGIIGSLLTLIISMWSQKKKDKRDYKMSVFRVLIAYRNDLIRGHSSSGRFECAMNEIFVAYNDSPAVIAAFEDLRKTIGIPNGDLMGKLLTMLKAMADDLGIRYEFANDDLFTKPLQFGPKDN